MSPPASLFIATPTTDGVALAPYVASLAAMVIRLAASGTAVEYRTLDGVDLIAQRNLLTAAFLASDYTHLLFIDSDMTFPPDLAERLIAFEKRVIGAVYPRRRLDLDLLKVLLASEPFENALALAHEWNLHPLDGQVTVRNGICQVAALPGGFLMIERQCLGEMAARLALPETSRPGAPSVRGYFRETWQGDAVLDLDYSFCRSWRDAGGEVWAYPAADVRHVGDLQANLPFAALLTSAAHGTAAGPSRHREAAPP